MELKYYKKSIKKYFFVSYLNKYDKIYAYIFSSKSWNSTSIELYDGLFDFKLTDSPIAPKNNEYPMRLLMYNNSKINLEKCYIILENQELINKILNRTKRLLILYYFLMHFLILKMIIFIL